MSLKDFVSSIVPHFDRSRIIEDIDSLATNLEQNLIPSYTAAGQNFRQRKLASNFGQQIDGFFALRFPQRKSIGHILFIKEVLQQQLEILKVFERLVPELFNRDVTKDTLTYKKAAVLQYLSVVRFANDYAGQHLLRLVAAEDFTARGEADRVDSQLLPAEIGFLSKNLDLFFSCLRVMSASPDEIVQKLGKMQDLQLIVDKIATVEATLGMDNTDPLRLGLMGGVATNGLIYTIRSAYATYQTNNHKAKIEERRVLQLRLLSLKDAYSGTKNPRLEQQIAYNEGRLQRMNQEIAEFQERYG